MKVDKLSEAEVKGKSLKDMDAKDNYDVQQNISLVKPVPEKPKK